MDKTINALVNKIKSTREFEDLKKSIANLDKYEDTKKKFQMLQKKQMALLQSNKPPQVKEQQAKEIDKEFQILSKNSEVNKMFKAGENFNKRINKIYKEINKLLYSDLKL